MFSCHPFAPQESVRGTSITLSHYNRETQRVGLHHLLWPTVDEVSQRTQLRLLHRLRHVPTWAAQILCAHAREGSDSESAGQRLNPPRADPGK